MKKVIRLGKANGVGSVFCEIEITDGKLSITGVEGPMKNGDARGSCGQISQPKLTEYAPGWTEGEVSNFFNVWRRWHLNDMRAGCEHQRKMGWDKIPIDPSKPLDAYGKHFPGQSMDSWNMATWIRKEEHLCGLMCEPCPECGYKYGSQWLREELPADVVKYLESLPETDIQPAWV